MGEGCQLLVKVVYADDIPKDVVIKCGNVLLVGTKPKGDGSDERLRSQEGK